MSVVRFGVSLEQELLEALDDFVIKNKFTNRSQAIRQLIADHTARTKWMCHNQVAGSITLIYNFHKRNVTEQIFQIQHANQSLILGSQHFNLGSDSCMQIIAIKGEACQLTNLSDQFIAIKGIHHGKLTMSRTEQTLNTKK